MNVSRRSWHFWVYTHTYVNNPKDGCSYLRKLIWACLWFIPLTIFFIPNLVVELWRSRFNLKRFDYPVYVTEIPMAFWHFFAACFIICMATLMWFHVPPNVFTSKKDAWHIFFLLGFVGWALVIIVGIILGILYVIQSIVDYIKGRPNRERKPTLLSIYIKAFKEKNCPKINIVD
jgi:hypothetical protein